MAFRQNYLSHSTEKLRKGTVLCLRMVLSSKKSKHTRAGFFVTVTKIFEEEPFNVSPNWGFENFHAKEGRDTVFC